MFPRSCDVSFMCLSVFKITFLIELGVCNGTQKSLSFGVESQVFIVWLYALKLNWTDQFCSFSYTDSYFLFTEVSPLWISISSVRLLWWFLLPVKAAIAWANRFQVWTAQVHFIGLDILNGYYHYISHHILKVMMLINPSDLANALAIWI